MDSLLLSTVMIAGLHALVPDHWLPFVMLARAQNWSQSRLTAITFLGGLGHVASSLLIGVIGISLGIAMEKINLWESNRGNVAGLLLIGFGLLYTLWGIKNWGRKHSHELTTAKLVSSWTLFALVVFGPCEPLIPIFIAGSAFGWMHVLTLSVVFGVTTILMMLLQVHLGVRGISLIASHRFERASDVVAGAVITLTGVGIRVLGV